MKVLQEGAVCLLYPQLVVDDDDTGPDRVDDLFIVILQHGDLAYEALHLLLVLVKLQRHFVETGEQLSHFTSRPRSQGGVVAAVFHPVHAAQQLFHGPGNVLREKKTQQRGEHCTKQ